MHSDDSELMRAKLSSRRIDRNEVGTPTCPEKRKQTRPQVKENISVYFGVANAHPLCCVRSVAFSSTQAGRAGSKGPQLSEKSHNENENDTKCYKMIPSLHMEPAAVTYAEAVTRAHIHLRVWDMHYSQTQPNSIRSTTIK